MNTKQLIKITIEALEDIKANEIVVLEAEKNVSLFDYILVASATSSRQANAIANHIRGKVKAAGGAIYGIEGERTGEWLLVDLGDVIVHIMQPTTRAYYNLEALWSESAHYQNHLQP